MENLKSFLFANLTNISIGLGLYGIILHLITLYYPEVQYFYHLKPIYFEDYLWRFRTDRLNNPGPYIAPVLLLFFSLMIIGGFLYKRSENKDARLLRFSYAIIFVHKLITLPMICLNYCNFTRLIAQNPANKNSIFADFSYTTAFVCTFPFLILSYIISKKLMDDQMMNYENKENEAGIEEFFYEAASKKNRFAHLIFDFIIMLLLVYPLTSIIRYYLGEKSEYIRITGFMMDSNTSLWIIFTLCLYYLLFEGFFHATPAKFITGTRVLDSTTLEKPSFGQILTRTFARRIPFNAFSFLGKKGWHDAITNTTVVKEEVFEPTKSYHRWWAIIFLSFYLIPIGYLKIKEEWLSMRSSSFHSEILMAVNILIS